PSPQISTLSLHDALPISAYGMTKAALEMLAKNLVIELSQYRINVNALAPGATLTERTAEDKNYLETWSEITPMGRPAYPADIAQDRKSTRLNSSHVKTSY